MNQNKKTDACPFVTEAEQVFLRHDTAETFQAWSGPATSRLAERGLDWNGMAVFRRRGAAHDDRFLLEINEVTLPPFQAPWSSREQFLAIVDELLEVYPDLKPLMRSSINEETTA